ncbi:MAG: SurA N-terminal domain-containing protein [Patescibacteria group bacterium]
MKTKKIKPNSKIIKIAAVSLGIILLAFFLKNQVVVAWVNGRPIWRRDYNKTVVKIAGKQAMDNLTTQSMVLSEAKKQKVDVTQDEIEAEIKRLEEMLTGQGQNLDELLAAQNLTRKDITEEIRMQKLIEKLVGSAEVSDEEVDTYIADNKTMFDKTAKIKELKPSIKKQLEQQKLSGKIQELVAKLQQEAKVLSWI